MRTFTGFVGVRGWLLLCSDRRETDKGVSVTPSGIGYARSGVEEDGVSCWGRRGDLGSALGVVPL